MSYRTPVRRIELFNGQYNCYNFVKGEETMKDIEKVIELYLQAGEELKSCVEQILIVFQLPAEHQPEHSGIDRQNVLSSHQEEDPR